MVLARVPAKPENKERRIKSLGSESNPVLARGRFCRHLIPYEAL